MTARQVDEIVAKAQRSRPRPARAVSPTTRTRKLTARQRQELADAYESGTPVLEIAREFGLSKDRVVVQLNKAGVIRRPRSMSEQQIDQAVRLYEAGVSLAKVGERLGFTARTIQLRLRERGVVFRDTHGRVR